MMMKTRTFCVVTMCAVILAAMGAGAQEDAALVIGKGLILDLDADKGVTVEGGDKVVNWRNQVGGFVARDFGKRDEGRETVGSGRPALKKNVSGLSGHSSLVFREDELLNMDEDAFDHLIQGSGYTWITVMSAYAQRVGLRDVNVMLGNLRNGPEYEGLWVGLEDDNDLWMGSRNGVTFGRYNSDNPKLMGPRLEEDRYYILAGRMGAGTGMVVIEVFVDSPVAFGSVEYPVNPDADPSKMAVGTERDATNHPGHESFDGELARVLMYERPLSDEELARTFSSLRTIYFGGAPADSLETEFARRKKVIFETDMCLDVDDVGALAMLHAMADGGEADILAVSFNEVHESGVAAIDAINTWYGRGDIPIGTYKGEIEDPDTSKYLGHVAKFPHDASNETAPSSLDLYLEVLRAQPDDSVTIISVGFLNNLYDLLKAEPTLIEQKVVELVVMGGLRNDGFNLVRHNLSDQSEYVIRNWPTPLVISQPGGSVHTGTKLSDAPEENPVRESFYRWFDESYKGRSSWDQVAVLYGVRGLGENFSLNTSGTGRLRSGFEWALEAGKRTALNAELTNEEFVAVIEPLMIEAPRR